MSPAQACFVTFLSLKTMTLFCDISASKNKSLQGHQPTPNGNITLLMPENFPTDKIPTLWLMSNIFANKFTNRILENSCKSLDRVTNFIFLFNSEFYPFVYIRGISQTWQNISLNCATGFISTPPIYPNAPPPPQWDLMWYFVKMGLSLSDAALCPWVPH